MAMENQGTGSDECIRMCFRKHQRMLCGVHYGMPQEMLQRMPGTPYSIKTELLDLPMLHKGRLCDF